MAVGAATVAYVAVSRLESTKDYDAAVAAIRAPLPEQPRMLNLIRSLEHRRSKTDNGLTALEEGVTTALQTAG